MYKKIILLIIIIVSFIIYKVFAFKENIKIIEKNATEVSKEIIKQKEENKNTEIVENDNEENEALGVLIFDNGLKVAIYNGVNDESLFNGVGKFLNNSIINEMGNVILLGHRDTSFKVLEKIVKGDTIIVESYEKRIEYIVGNTYITTKDDALPYEESDSLKLTLITCYPFVYAGPAPKRFIVEAYPNI